jgi:hypothetical protein
MSWLDSAIDDPADYTHAAQSTLYRPAARHPRGSPSDRILFAGTSAPRGYMRQDNSLGPSTQARTAPPLPTIPFEQRISCCCCGTKLRVNADSAHKAFKCSVCQTICQVADNNTTTNPVGTCVVKIPFVVADLTLFLPFLSAYYARRGGEVISFGVHRCRRFSTHFDGSFDRSFYQHTVSGEKFRGNVGHLVSGWPI